MNGIPLVKSSCNNPLEFITRFARGPTLLKNVLSNFTIKKCEVHPQNFLVLLHTSIVILQ